MAKLFSMYAWTMNDICVDYMVTAVCLSVVSLTIQSGCLTVNQDHYLFLSCVYDVVIIRTKTTANNCLWNFALRNYVVF